MDKDHLPTGPEAVEHIKAAILDHWQRLPQEAQAVVLAEQLQIALDSEAGAPLREVLQRAETQTGPLHQVFPITGVSRADLLERLHFHEQEVLELEDRDMGEIAGRLKDHYLELSFWDDLDFVTRHVLERKRRIPRQP